MLVHRAIRTWFSLTPRILTLSRPTVGLLLMTRCTGLILLQRKGLSSRTEKQHGRSSTRICVSGAPLAQVTCPSLSRHDRDRRSQSLFGRNCRAFQSLLQVLSGPDRVLISFNGWLQGVHHGLVAYCSLSSQYNSCKT